MWSQASGHGLALSGVVLEQDAAYFEVHVEMASAGSAEIKAGVATKKDRQFYTVREDAEGGMFYNIDPLKGDTTDFDC